MSWVKIPNTPSKAIEEHFGLKKDVGGAIAAYDQKNDTMTMVLYNRATSIIDAKGVKRPLMKGRVVVLKGKKGKNGEVGPPMVPRAIEVTPKVRQIFRYICNGSVTPASITYGDLLGMAGGICTVVNTTLRLIATSMRIIKIVVWPPAAATGSNPSVSELNWVGANADQTPDLAWNETLPSGSPTPGAIINKPPPKSLAEDWFNNAVTLADVVFTLYTGQGTLVDLEVEYTQPNGLLSSAITIATGVLGTFYYLCLNHSGSKNIFPATLPNTT